MPCSCHPEMAHLPDIGVELEAIFLFLNRHTYSSSSCWLFQSVLADLYFHLGKWNLKEACGLVEIPGGFAQHLLQQFMFFVLQSLDFVIVHRAPHLLCSRVLEVQSVRRRTRRRAYAAPCERLPAVEATDGGYFNPVTMYLVFISPCSRFRKLYIGVNAKKKMKRI